jgi:predicted secreted protein
MATTGVLNGTDLKVFVFDTTWKAVAYAQSAAVTMTQDVRDITSKDSNGKREIAEGKTSWNLNTDLLLAWDATYGFEELFGAWNERKKIQVRFTTEESGDLVLSGFGYVNSVSVNGGVEDNGSASLSVEGTGELTKSTLT